MESSRLLASALPFSWSGLVLFFPRSFDEGVGVSCLWFSSFFLVCFLLGGGFFPIYGKEQVPFAENTFDSIVVISSWVESARWFPNQRLLGFLSGVLKKQGRIVIRLHRTEVEVLHSIVSVHVFS